MGGCNHWRIEGDRGEDIHSDFMCVLGLTGCWESLLRCMPLRHVTGVMVDWEMWCVCAA